MRKAASNWALPAKTTVRTSTPNILVLFRTANQSQSEISNKSYGNTTHIKEAI